VEFAFVLPWNIHDRMRIAANRGAARKTRVPERNIYAALEHDLPQASREIARTQARQTPLFECPIEHERNERQSDLNDIHFSSKERGA
jgi:hypothetical protein